MEDVGIGATEESATRLAAVVLFGPEFVERAGAELVKSLRNNPRAWGALLLNMWKVSGSVATIAGARPSVKPGPPGTAVASLSTGRSDWAAVESARTSTRVASAVVSAPDSGAAAAVKDRVEELGTMAPEGGVERIDVFDPAEDDQLTVRDPDRTYAYEEVRDHLVGLLVEKTGYPPVTFEDLGRQVRQAFYGEEVQRIQRGRDDVRVRARFPREERRSLGNLEDMRIRVPNGGEVPFGGVAVVRPGRGFSSVMRVDGNRVVDVTAAVDPTATSAGDVNGDLRQRILPEVLAKHPGVTYTFGGVEAQQASAIGGLQRGFLLALLAVFALLAIPLKSYLQPVIVMAAIPFGFVGAIWGHIVLGLEFSFVSMLGLVALTGVVVNDSLVMVDFINRERRDCGDVYIATRESGCRRFRPIFLTSLTTFCGLVPLMLDRSMEASFLLPMAVSLAFGVLFATLVSLILVPVTYIVLDDVDRMCRRALRGLRGR